MKNFIILIIFSFSLSLYGGGENFPFGMNHEIFETQYSNTQYSFDDDQEYRQKYKTSMDLSAAAGIKWWRAKNAFRWCDIQRENSTSWNFETEDSLVKWAGERGLHLLPVIGNTAKWAHHGSIPSEKSQYWIKYPPNPEHWVDYENYVKALVERYNGDGIDDYEDLKIPIKHWEFMNEPYQDSDFLGTPKQYVEMFGHTMSALKSADSTAKILGPCFTSRESDTFKWKYYDTETETIVDTNLGPWDQALMNLIDSIGLENIDIITHHLYKKPDLFSFYVTRLRDILEQYPGGENKPIWITESGFQNSSRFRAVRGKEQICDETGSLRLVKYSSDTGEVFRDTVWVQQGNLESCFDTVITFLDTGDTVILKYRTNWWKSDTVIYNGGDLIYIKGENTVTALAINDTLTIYKVWARETEYNCPDSQKTRYSELLDTIINTSNFLRNLKVFFFCANNNMNIHYYPPVIEFGNTPYEPTVYVPTAYYRQRLHNLYSVIDTMDDPYPAYYTIHNKILGSGDTTLPNTTINTNETKTYQAKNSITTNDFTIENGGTVAMEAGDKINLKPGFRVELGGYFYGSTNELYGGGMGLSSMKGIAIPKEIKASNESVSKDSIPKVFSCAQNFPNPFAKSTIIKYGLPKDVEVKLDIYNLIGQKVRTLVNANESAGYKSVSWDSRTSAGTQAPQGIYFYTFEAGDFTKHRKMILLK